MNGAANLTPYKPGEGGGKPGTRHAVPKTFKTILEATFYEGGGKEWLLAWGKKNPTEFFKIMGRLIPAEVNAKVGLSSDIVDLMREGRERVKRMRERSLQDETPDLVLQPQAATFSVAPLIGAELAE